MSDFEKAPPVSTLNRLIRSLKLHLGADNIIVDAESQRPYECDALSIYHDLPLLVALPETVAEVQQVMRVCHELNVPVVARGAGTGLCAGAMPHPAGVLKRCSDHLHLQQLKPQYRGRRPANLASGQPLVENVISCKHYS